MVKTYKFAPIALTLLVPALLLCALILSAVGTSGKGWTWRIELVDPETRECMGVNHRGPFQYCVLRPREDAPQSATSTTTAVEETPTDASDEPPPETSEAAPGESTPTPTPSPAVISCPNADSQARFVQVCERYQRPGHACTVNSTIWTTFLGREANGDYSSFCQQLEISGALLVAGCVLIGVGMFSSLILSAISLLQTLGGGRMADRISSTSTATLALLTGTLSGLGALAVLFGTIIATNDLINQQFPAGNWTYGGDAVNSTNASPWLIGRSVGIASAGWVLAGVAASLVTKVWPWPAQTYDRVYEEDVATGTTRGGKNDRTE